MSSKCSNCNKKTGSILIECKCKNMYCIKCSKLDVHKCTFDYKTNYSAKLKVDNPIVVSEKIIKI